MNRHPRGFAVIPLVLIIVAVLAVGTVGYVAFVQPADETDTNTTTTIPIINAETNSNRTTNETSNSNRSDPEQNFNLNLANANVSANINASPPTNVNSTLCPTDAKLCPDGSYVSRSGPNCEFTECPSTNTNTNASRKACVSDSDCGLLICSGCFAKTYLETAPPDLACRDYEGYTCVCLNNTCTPAQITP